MNHKKVSLFLLCLAFLCLSASNAWCADPTILNLNVVSARVSWPVLAL